MKIKTFGLTNDINKNQNKQPNFSGHILTKDEYGFNVYKFFLPNAPKGTKVVYTKLVKDSDNKYTALTSKQDNKIKIKLAEKELSGDNIPSCTISADDLNLNNDVILGYKFKLPNGKYYFDNTAKGFVDGFDNNDEKTFTMATPMWTSNSTRPRVMEHFLVDSLNVADNKVKRNHFNLLGGTLKSVNEMVEKFANAGITAYLATPIFGQDNNSSHGYWTTNPYQITNNFGDISDFKELMINLYKHDQRWTADGAFVNEGIPGVHIKDIVTWGAESPCIDMYETKDLDNLPARFGVLSKNQEVNKHIHFKLVNAPYKILFEKTPDGYYIEKSVKKHSVDPTKPTYVQVFDDRLASEEQMNDDSVFSVYANKDAGNNFEIANYRDSVQAYYHRVSLREVEANYKKYKEVKSFDKDIEFKNLLTKWTNFEFVESNKDGGVSLWVGNSDITKKQFVIPERILPDNMSFEKLQQKYAAQFQVQDDTVQVGKFWTNEVARTLTEYTARQIAHKVNSTSATAEMYENAIRDLIDEGKLPKGSEEILKKNGDEPSPLENILTQDFWGDGRNYKLRNVKVPVSLTDGMMSYPFDAIEFSPDLVSVFTYPYIKNLAVTEDTVGKSRFDMYKMGDSYYELMPEKYRKLYKQTDNLIANDMTKQAKNIMQHLEEKLGKQLLGENDTLTEEGKDIYSIISSDIAKFLIVSALAPKIKPNYENKNMLEYNVKDLNDVSLNSLNLQYEVSPEDVAKRLIEKIRKGISSISDKNYEEFVDYLQNRLNNINSDSVNVARLIIEQTESGLDWRIDAAKDVGNFEAVEDGTFAYDENVKHITSFWNKFNKGVREYNPRSYTIGELTDWEDSISDFVLQSGFSTLSDYNYFYSLLPALYGKNADGQNKNDNEFANEIATKLDEFLNSGFADNVNFAHRFIGNHDKPRIHHLFAMDSAEFIDKNFDKKPEIMERIIKRAFENSGVFNSLEQRYKDILLTALHNLRNGRVTKNGKIVQFDWENFGVRPFSTNIDFIISEAVNENEDFANFVNNPDNAHTIKKLKVQTLQDMLSAPMEKYRALWFAMNALPGTPTMYAGDELAMTGWETVSKNEKQENRNRIPWELLEDQDYWFIKDYKRKLDDITKIRTKDGASALTNGTVVALNRPCHKAYAFYRYNNETDAICVLHANGFSGDERSRGADLYAEKIDLGGLPNGLQKGTIYVDALNPSSKYKVTNQYEIKKIDDNGNICNEINLGNAGLILLRETGFDGKKFSFKGRIQNPHVKLANTKYNFSYMQN